MAYLRALIALPEQEAPAYVVGARRLTDLYIPPEVLDESRRERVAWAHAWQAHRCAVLLGHPGEGKTLLTRMTVRALAEDSLAKFTAQRHEVHDIRMPVCVRLSEVAEHQSLEAAVRTSIQTLLTGLEPTAPAAPLTDLVVSHVQAMLCTDRCCLFLEALEEVPDNQRARLTSALERLRHAACRVVVTSRPYEYYRGILPLGNAATYALAPLSLQQQQQFLAAWFREDARRRDAVIAFVEGHSQCGETAWLLTLICHYADHHDLILGTTQPADLYNAIVQTQLGTHRNPHEVRVVLEQVAWDLFQAAPKNTLYRYARFREAVSTAGQRLRISADPATLLEQLCHTGLVVVPSTDQARFAPPLLRDFLAAEYLASLDNPLPQVAKLLWQDAMGTVQWRPEAAPMLQHLARALADPPALLQRFVDAYDRQSAAPGATPMALHVLIMKRRGHTVSELQPGEILTAQDHYGVFFAPQQSAYIYVVQQDATGRIDVLFPNPQWSPQTNPVPAGQTVWVPKNFEHWFYLDAHVGQEVIYVVATRTRNAWLESLLHCPNTAGAVETFTAWLLSPERGVGGMRRLPATSLSTPDARPVTLEAVLAQGRSVEFVYKAEFQHA
jgi:hypothetical protein